MKLDNGAHNAYNSKVCCLPTCVFCRHRYRLRSHPTCVETPRKLWNFQENVSLLYRVEKINGTSGKSINARYLPLKNMYVLFEAKHYKLRFDT